MRTEGHDPDGRRRRISLQRRDRCRGIQPARVQIQQNEIRSGRASGQIGGVPDEYRIHSGLLCGGTYARAEHQVIHDGDNGTTGLGIFHRVNRMGGISQ